MITEEKQKLIGNFYRRKKIKDKYLLTTDSGTWVILDEDEYNSFIENKMDNKLLDTLISRGFLFEEGKYDLVVDSYIKRYQGISSGACLHIVVPTIRCNHCCIYCHSEAESLYHSSKGQYDMDEETVKRILNFIFESPSKKITIEFQGGEPLLNKPMIKSVINYSRELNKEYNKDYRIALVTNLTELDDNFFEFLVQNKDILSIATSLDGPEELHNKNRHYVNKDVGPFRKVVYWIKRFMEKGIRVGLLMVTTRYSLPYWKEIIDLYVEFEQESIQIKPLDYLGFAVKQWDKIGYTAEEFNQFWKKCVDYMLELNRKGIMITERYLSLALKKILYSLDTNYYDLASPCGLLRGQIVYNYNGDIYPCDESRIMEGLIIGNVDSDTYESVIRSAKGQKLIEVSINDKYYCDSCVYKPYCGVCPVLTYAQREDFMIKLNKTDRCERLRFLFDYTFNLIINNTEEVKRLILGRMLKNRVKSVFNE